MRNINDFTIAEFEQYKELLAEPQDVFGAMELFGISDPQGLPLDKYNKYWSEILNQSLSTQPIKKIYTINGKRYKAELDVLKLNAAQFLDLQHYLGDFKLEEVLSIFLLPQYKKNFIWHTYKYNDGYDLLNVQKELKDHMKMSQTSELSAFFFRTSLNLLRVMTDRSQKKLAMLQMKDIKRREKMQ